MKYEFCLFNTKEWEEILGSDDSLVEYFKNDLDIKEVHVLFEKNKTFLLLLFNDGFIKKINSYTLFKNYDYIGLLESLSNIDVSFYPFILRNTLVNHYIIQEKVEKFIDSYIGEVEYYLRDKDSYHMFDEIEELYEFRFLQNEPFYITLSKKNEHFKKMLEVTKPEFFI